MTDCQHEWERTLSDSYAKCVRCQAKGMFVDLDDNGGQGIVEVEE